MRIIRRKIAFFLFGGILIFALFYYLFIFSPVMAKQKPLEKNITKKEADLLKMVELNLKWDRFKYNKVEAEKTLARRGMKFTLLSFLEGVSRKTGIHDKIQYMKPISTPEESGSIKQAGMEIKLEDMDIGQLVSFLYEIEYSGKLLTIKRIKIQRKAQSLRVILQVHTYTTT